VSGFSRTVIYHDAVPTVELHQDLRSAVRDLCKAFPDSYWRELDAARAYPDAFVKALTSAGYLAALIPESHGGSGLGIGEAAIILEEINHSGGNAGACHAQMYTMGTLLRHGSDAQKREFLPKIATGELRLQAFGVTEPTTGSDTTQLKTTAVRKGDSYIIRGQKVWISRAEHSDLLLLVVRTTPIEAVKKRTDGLSVLLIVAYGLGMLFSLMTHRELFASAEHGETGETPWPIGLAVGTLAGVTVLVALVSEIFVESVQKAAETFGMSPAFVGFVIVSLVGAAAEFAVAFSAARKDRLDMSVSIALGSASQIALFVAPALVLLSYVVGPSPMSLQFWPGAVTMVMIATVTASFITSSGRSAWFIGALLIFIYAVFALTLYVVPPTSQGAS